MTMTSTLSLPGTPAPYDLSLPYPSWQPGQWDTIVRLASSDKKIILLEAPTGSGKSGLAVGYATLMGEPLLVLTGTLQLQDQYEAQLGLLTARGRPNFPCQLDPAVMASEAVCTVGSACHHKSYTRHLFYPDLEHDAETCVSCQKSGDVPCMYYYQRFVAESAGEVVLNYPYWLALANYSGAFQKRAIMVFDEAHALEDEVRRFATVRFTRRQADLLSLTIPWMPAEDVAAWGAWVKTGRMRMAREYRAITQGTAGPPAGGHDEQRRKSLLAFCRAADMLFSQPSDSWVGEKEIIRGMETGTTTFKPIWVSGVSQRVLTRHFGEKVILMSGTILDPDMYCDSLGLNTDDVDFIRVPSTFPAERRPFYYEPIGKLNVNDPTKITRLVTGIDQILDKYPSRRGIIHTVSYKLAEYIVTRSRHSPRMIGHDSKNKVAQLNYYKTRSDGIWISPSSGVGLDLPYDLCEFQIIAKLPFPDLGDKQIKQRMKTGPDGRPLPSASRWYNWLTACQLIQMYGRGMRAPDDRCDTYLLDGNYGWFRHYFRSVAPEWVLKAMRRPRVTYRDPYENESGTDMLARLLAQD